MKPYDYKQKIFDVAKDRNSIIYVETGKGKTFISIMLMAHLLGIDINKERNTQINIDFEIKKRVNNYMTIRLYYR